MKQPKPRVYWAIGALVVAVLLALIIWLGHWSIQVSRDLAILQRDTTVDTKKKFDASLEIAKAIVGGIGTVATIAGGVVLFLNFRVANRNAEIANRNAEIAQKKLEQEIEKAKTDAKLAESRLTMERFSKAVDMMGSDKSIHLRLGGIYALESIALDSSDDSIDQNYRQVLEVLTAFVRENSLYPPKQQVETELTHFRGPEPLDLSLPPLPTDIQAALTVINRRKHKDSSAEDRLNLSRWKDRLDLSKADLLDLSKADLRRANLGFANLQGANLRGANLQGASLEKANLQGADLREANFHNAWLGEANLQGANLWKADLQGANLGEANLHNAWLGEANLQEADLGEANLQEADLREANLQEANLREANFHKAWLGEANLQEADLWKANLQEADLRGAKLQEANFGEANLQRADLRGTNLQEADLWKANLQGANLWKADLQRANLEEANLQGADLRGTNLQGANLWKADLQEAVLLATDLRQAQELTQEQLEGKDLLLLCHAALPEGFPDKDTLKDRDCDKMPAVLHKRYPQEFTTLDDAKQYVDKQRKKQW